MKISVIIPVKNEASVITNVLQHVKKSASKPDFGEIILVDGNSTDQTVFLAQKEDVNIILAQIPGRASQMNEGAKKAQYEILYFLHADCFPPQNWDLLILNAISNQSKAGCFRLQFDDSHPLLRVYAWFTKFDFRFVRYGDQSLFVTKALFDKVNGFKNDHIVMEDNELVYRLKEFTTFKLLPNTVQTSARKYRSNGIIRLQCIFGLIYYGYQLGVSQSVLVDLYKRLIR